LSRALRLPLLVVAALAAPAGAWRLGRDPLVALAGPLRAADGAALASLRLETVLTGLFAALLLAGVAWLSGTTLLLAVLRLGAALAPGSRVLAEAASRVERLSPAVARALVVTTLGLAPGSAFVAPALADPAAAPGHHPAGTVHVLDGLPLPERTTGGTASTTGGTVPIARGTTSATEEQVRPARPADVVVVRPGDSLWSIAVDLLPSSASDARVRRTSAALYDANRDHLGPDPDLIHPGDRLTVPRPVAHHGEEDR